jgi:hypothetical protein
MIIGLGQVGGKTLEFLARKPGIARIVGADVNEVYGYQKVNNAVFGAQLEGFYPNIDFVKVDLSIPRACNPTGWLSSSRRRFTRNSRRLVMGPGCLCISHYVTT